MKSLDLHKIDNWIEKRISYPGINYDDLQLRKSYFIASAACLFVITLLTLSIVLIYPEFKILLSYGLFLLLIFIEFIIASIVIQNRLNKLMFFNQVLMIVGTFVAILKLGGIPHSGGLIFVGFFIVLFSLDFEQKRNSVWLFFIYIVTLILAGVLHPYLTTAPEMTSQVNIFLFVVNLFWISAFAFVFVLNFVSQRVDSEHKVAESLKEMNEVKTKLYTNITHEFRTPLTVILGMVDLIKDTPERWMHKGLQKISNNSKILLNLVNQMLALSKLEAGAMPVNSVQGDVILYIRYLVESLKSLAANRKIILRYYTEIDHLVMDYDPEKFMQIVSNLVSNALKYTHPKGVVEVRTLIDENRNFEIRVKDNGIGIRKEHLPYIFDRFYRVNPGEGATQPAGGSGLGLALTLELIRLLEGNIRVQSVFGKGTEFIVSLPVSNSAFLLRKGELPDISDNPLHVDYTSEGKRPVVSEANSGGRPLLLIVEDSNDVIEYLVALLETEYRIILASNGKEGWEKALRMGPHIIISDIMMPEMDGIKLLDKLKNDIHTSHIPVVILTAKVDVSSRLKGLRTGADAYIAKPFNKEELEIQLNKLIVLRKKLHNRYADVASHFSADDKVFEMEDSFIQTVREFMLKSVCDEEFSIKDLCFEVAMGRSQLYCKFKSLTNRTIFEYFQSLRLHKAKELLITTNANVSEAAFRTGFKNLSHFSRVFNKEFGVSPSKIKPQILPS